MMHNGWHDGGWGGGHWILAIVMMIVFWGVITMIVLAVVRSGRWSQHDHRSAPSTLTPTPPPTPPPAASPAPATLTADAERILHERFARGEIDDAEYTRRHDLLRERSR